MDKMGIKKGLDLTFFKDKKVLITGHTGFKGTWMCEVLSNSGAKITGYSLAPDSDLSLYQICDMDKKVNSVIGDISDLNKLMDVFESVRPEIVIHMAAQPIVRESYKNPVYTYQTNVMGTVNVCEAVRLSSSVKSFLNVTTDKVYKNNEWEWGYRETDVLSGFDPYSNSKSCSELVTQSYINSFFYDREISVSTARAGNVIGGGDFAADRIIPDCVRAALDNKKIVVRNPYSIRPYQHVLESLYAYLLILSEQYNHKKLSGSYNVGPDENDCITTGEIVSLFCQKWKEDLEWTTSINEGPHEANFLKLDCSRMKKTFNWHPRWSIDKTVEKTVEWYKVFRDKGNIEECMNKQIHEFFTI